MRRRIGVLLLVLVGFCVLSGCSQFSTKPPLIPGSITITDESFEKAYVLRTRGEPTIVQMDYDHADYYLELWFYPLQSSVVMFIIEGDKYRVQTYHYGVVK